ncbi:hypothetical protein pEaSNUABM11_00238 [Erwinia phage pEa_SNUABM_11]|nr:hypothetical protein pEaSNUABM11_00238 [Erwinia phage pEa_SNUABM_11]
MKLNELIAQAQKATKATDGMLLITVEPTVNRFALGFTETCPQLAGTEIDAARKLRVGAQQNRAWVVAYTVTHNPHCMLANEVDIALHLWQDGDNVIARIAKFRGLGSKPEGDFVLDQE